MRFSHLLRALVFQSKGIGLLRQLTGIGRGALHSIGEFAANENMLVWFESLASLTPETWQKSPAYQSAGIHTNQIAIALGVFED